jgi:hypothetical protein
MSAIIGLGVSWVVLGSQYARSVAGTTHVAAEGEQLWDDGLQILDRFGIEANGRYFQVSQLRRPGVDLLAVTTATEEDPELPIRTIVEVQAGWPVRQSVGWLMVRGDGGFMRGSHTTERRWLLSSGRSPVQKGPMPAEFAWVSDKKPMSWRLIPVRPRAVGTIANSSAYGAIAWAICFGCPRLRRAYRRRCGKCPYCAYILNKQTICSECGYDVTNSTK